MLKFVTMINSEHFINRLEKVMQFYGLSASQFADRIGVQRSSISHLLTGRNKPSLEFVMKLVTEFSDVNLYWLLYGQGSFPDLIAENDQTSSEDKVAKSKGIKKVDDFPSGYGDKLIKRVIIFYEDGSFEVYQNDN